MPPSMTDFSPVRTSFAAAQRIVSRAQTRVPLHMLLDQLELRASAALATRFTPSPDKWSKGPHFARPKGTASSRPKSTAAVKIAPRLLPASVLAPTPAAVPAAAPAAAPAAHRYPHVRREVHVLYENWIEQRNRQPSLVRPSSAWFKQTQKAVRPARPASAAQPPPPSSFLEVLRMYYPTFSRPMLDEMLADARNGIDEIDRRRWAVRTRATQAERVRLAFDKSDKDKNGGLDLDEFLAAVQDACDGGRVRAHASTPMPTLEELRHLFTSADADGNGVLDVDEFVALCATQTWLVAAFDKVVETGLQRRRSREHAKLSTLFRHPISPLSRAIHEPNGQRRFRPSLHDLRPTTDIGEEVARNQKW